MLPHPLLQEIFATGEVLDQHGNRIALHSHIVAENVAGLYRAVLQQRPHRVLEIGMAYGVSSLTILAALEELDAGGRLVSIDPYQTKRWQGGGLATVARAGLGGRHELIEDFDYLALPRLLESGRRFELAYIDGYHSFDYVMMDFFHSDLLLEVGGTLGFNDCGWKSVFKVIRFVQSHKQYEEIDVGIAADYHGRNPLYTLGRRLLGFNRADRYFRKLADQQPANDFYARF